MVYQVSYVIRGAKGEGKITTLDHTPRVGEMVRFDGRLFRVLEVEELIKPLSQFSYYHVLCETV